MKNYIIPQVPNIHALCICVYATMQVWTVSVTAEADTGLIKDNTSWTQPPTRVVRDK